MISKHVTLAWLHELIRSGDTSPFYHTREWVELRNRKLEAEHNECERCRAKGRFLKFKVNGVIYTKQHSWVCEKSRDWTRIKFPIRDAEREGLLTVVNTVEISPELPVKWLKEMKQRYRIIAGALDSYRYDLLKWYLDQIGFDPNKDGQDNLKLVRPSDIVRVQPQIKSDLDNQRVIFGDDKLMRWYTNNTKLVKVKGANYKTDNFTFGKIEPKSRKTDGFFAFAAAYTQDDKIEQSEISTDIFGLMKVRSY